MNWRTVRSLVGGLLIGSMWLGCSTEAPITDASAPAPTASSAVATPAPADSLAQAEGELTAQFQLAQLSCLHHANFQLDPLGDDCCYEVLLDTPCKAGQTLQITTSSTTTVTSVTHAPPYVDAGLPDASWTIPGAPIASGPTSLGTICFDTANGAGAVKVSLLAQNGKRIGTLKLPVSCPKTGACCTEDGCVQTTEKECAALNGVSPTDPYVANIFHPGMSCDEVQCQTDCCQVTIDLTVDNVYALYRGTATNVTQLLGHNNDWRSVESYTTCLKPDEFLYVAAWSDAGVFQGFASEVSGPNGSIVNGAGWTVNPTNIHLGVGAAPPSLATVSAAATGTFVAPTVGPLNGVYPGLSVSGLPPSTRWIWHNSGNCTGTHQPFRSGCDHDEFLLFRFNPKKVCHEPTGACCTPQQGCLDTPASQCQQMGGSFTPGVTCASDPAMCCTIDEVPVACCFGNGCDVMPPCKCKAMGGTPFPGELTCDNASEICCKGKAKGACCTDHGCLENVSSCTCKLEGGTFYPKRTCQDIAGECCVDQTLGACCTDGGCKFVKACECEKMGGSFQPGHTCDEAGICCENQELGACCVQSSAGAIGCKDGLNECACDALGGTFSAGLSCQDNPCEEGCCDVTIDITADNFLAVYTGTATAATAYLGSHFNLKQAGHFATCLEDADEYIYVAAWSDDRVYQGLLGQFNGPNGTIYTNHPAIEVLATGIDLDFSTQTPTIAQLNLQLGGTWGPATVGNPNANIWPIPFISGISALANWIWYDSGNCTGTLQPFRPGCNHDEYLIFRIPTSLLCGDPTGACCTDNGCIPEVTADECKAMLGTFTEGASCDEVNCCNTIAFGACCLGNQCIETVECECQAAGGQFFPGTPCDEIAPICCEDLTKGACCTATGCVDVANKCMCQDLGGMFHPNTPCSQLPPSECCPENIKGACCTEDGCVDVANKCVCEEMGGTFEALQACSDVTTCCDETLEGACCTDGQCFFTVECECKAAGGDFHAGVACDEILGTCCPDTAVGACCTIDAAGNQTCHDQVNSCQCEAMNGAFHPGQACSEGVCDDDCCEIDIHVTADNFLAVYTGTATAATQLVGTHASWQTAGTFTVCLPEDEFIYVAGWSDDGVYQGLLGEFVGPNGTLYTGDPSISVYATGIDLDYASQTPTTAMITAQLGNVFGPTAVGNPNGNFYPMSLVPGISTAANWIWYESGNCPHPQSPFRPGCNHDEYLIFRVPVSQLCGDPQGACCTPKGCFQTTAEKCEDVQGFFTEGASCDEVDCCQATPPGACCTDEGCFENYSECGCNELGGDFFSGMTCKEAAPICCQHQEPVACCFGEGLCEALPPCVCEDFGGTPFPGESCDTVQQICCPDAELGACCTGDDCTENMNSCQCDAMGGTFHVGQTCDSVGSLCCADDRIGACCTGNGCKEGANSCQCKEAGGVFYPFQGCNDIKDFCCPNPEFGACCNQVAATGAVFCEDGLTECACDEKGGDFFPNLTCEQASVECCPVQQPGACCTADGCFDVVNPCQCNQLGGMFNPAGSCANPLACCFDDAPGACCFGDSCETMTACGCETFGGVFLGGVSCDEAAEVCCEDITEGACCTDEGCFDGVNKCQCAEMAGVFHPQQTCDSDVCDSDCCTITLELANDNFLGVYTGNATQATAYHGNHGDWKNAKTFEICVQPGEFIYIAGWSDDAAYQGLVGEITGPNGTSLSGATWVVHDTNMDIDTLAQTPSLPNISAQIAAATWGPPAVGPTNSAWPPGTVAGIPGNANRIWYNSGNCGGSNQPFWGGCNHNEYLIFQIRTQELCGPPVTGACCVQTPVAGVGGCLEALTEDACDQLGGMFTAGATCAEVDCCVASALGACCADGQCVETSECDCNAMGGAFFFNTPCSQMPPGACCPDQEPGACCGDFDGDGLKDCISTLNACACDAAGGTFTPGATCDEVDCCIATALGACCADGQCIETSECQCNAMGGAFFFNTPCSQVPPGACCPFQEPGACCGDFDGDGVKDCDDTLDACTCDALGGTFTPGVSCDNKPCCDSTQLGACCTGNECVQTVECECIAMNGSFFPGATCAEIASICCDPTIVGACCTGDACKKSNPCECADIGGDFYPGLSCEQVAHECCDPELLGACCTGNDCQQTSQCACTELGGDFFANTPCEEIASICCESIKPGACCLPTGCVDVDNKCMCQAMGGTFTQDVACANLPAFQCCPDTTKGACCTDAGCVDVANKCQCESLGGTFTALTACNSTPSPCCNSTAQGACCTGDTCSQSTECECSELGGEFFAGTSCEEVLAVCCEDLTEGACCTDAGCVAQVNHCQCEAMGGTFNPGAACDDPTICQSDCCQVRLIASTDNWMAVYVGDAAGAHTLIGSSEGPASPGTIYDMCVQPGEVIYVAGWSDDSAWQGFIGELNGPFGQILTGDGSYEVFATGIDLDNGTQVPTLAALNTQIGLAVWGPPVVGILNSNTFPIFFINGVSALARWIWHDSGNCVGSTQPFFVGCNHDEYLIFRVSPELVCEPQPVTGACCLPAPPGTTSGQCVDGITEAECVAQGGDFTEGVPCDAVDCGPPPPIGACCIQDSAGVATGECLDFVTAEECELHFGIFHQDQFCDEVQCAPEPPIGACCLRGPTGAFTGECLDFVTAAECELAFGSFNVDMLCDEVVCLPPVLGACCLIDPATGALTGECISGVSKAECPKSQGIFTPNANCNQVQCVPEPLDGACCLPDIPGIPPNTCLDSIAKEACTSQGGTFFGGVPCVAIDCGPPPTGSCCIFAGAFSACFENRTEEQCANDGGQFSEGLTCSQTQCCDPTQIGACCNGIDCVQTTQCECDAMNPAGAEFFVGMSCEEACPVEIPVGACCLAVGCLEGVTAVQCEAKGGAFAQDQLCQDVCPTKGACCIEGQCNEDVSQQECAQAGGAFGAGMTCAQAAAADICPIVQNEGACCLASGCTENLSATQCATEGGGFVPGGHCGTATTGAICDDFFNEQLGACCVDGFCFNGMSVAQCLGVSGQPHPNQTCAMINNCK